MSPSLKYLMVSSIAARKASSEPMSLTATLGVEVASVLLVMCRWTPDADRDGLLDSTMRGWPDNGKPWIRDLPGQHDRPRPAVRLPRGCLTIGGLHQSTVQSPAYESLVGRSICRSPVSCRAVRPTRQAIPEPIGGHLPGSGDHSRAEPELAVDGEHGVIAAGVPGDHPPDVGQLSQDPLGDRGFEPLPEALAAVRGVNACVADVDAVRHRRPDGDVRKADKPPRRALDRVVRP